MDREPDDYWLAVDPKSQRREYLRHACTDEAFRAVFRLYLGEIERSLLVSF
jgi:hypothetical protein